MSSKRLHIILFILSVLYGTICGNCQTTTTGTDFWLTFMDNTDPQPGNDMLKVYVSAPQTCTFTLTNPNTGWSSSGTVQPGVVSSISVPQVQGYNTSTCTLLNKGLHLVATDTVAVYLSTTGLTSLDVCNVFPTSVLRDKYMIQTYPSDWNGSEFVVLATEDSTWVDIYLTDNTSDGHTTGTTLSVFFPNAGKSYQVKTPSVGDFSGTRVESRNCKKIAVFQGNACVYIPDHNASTCDHAIEEAVPVYNWGKHFVAIGCGSADYPDHVRITSLEDNCVVNKNNVFLCSLSAGETYEYLLYSAPANHGYDYIECSKPANLNIFFASTGNGTGDPSMLTISPLEQTIHNITFNCSNSGSTTNHYVVVTTRAADASLLRLDGNVITQNFVTVSANPDYKHIIIHVSAGSHTLSMSGGTGFIAHAYGLGNQESYAFNLGSSMNDLTSTLLVNGLSTTLNRTHHFCRGTNVNMSVMYSTPPDTIVWNFGDGTTGTGNIVNHSYNTPGQYTVNCTLTTDGGCLYYGVLTANLVIHDFDTVEIDTLCCDSLFSWHGSTYTVPGTLSHLQPNSYGCDSLTYLDLTFGQKSYIYTRDTTCEYQSLHDTVLTILLGQNTQGCDSIEIQTLTIHPINHTAQTVEGCDSLFFNDRMYYNDNTTDLTLENQFGCDSIIHVNIHVYDSKESIRDVYINEGDSLTWIDGRTYYDSTSDAYVTLHTVHGCDSVVRLHLHIIPAPEPPPIDSSTVWAPNAFTPDCETNSIFKVFGNDLIVVRVHIFNRWGLKVAEFDGLNEGWDGTCKGVPCKEEAYVYLIEYVTKDKPSYTHRKTGTVLLIR